MNDSETRSPRTLETVARACDVIEALEELDGAGVTELADYLGTSKSSMYTYLATLREKQLVVKAGDEYRLSLQFLYLGKTVRHSHPLYEHGKPQVDRLAADSGEYAHLMCEQHGLERNIYKAAGENAVGDEYHTMKQQKADYLHFTATGKAVLAHLPENRVNAIVDSYGLVRNTERTITDPDTLFEELETIRQRGYAINDEEEVTGIRAIGAPIKDEDGAVLGAISVSGPTGRIDGELISETLPDLVMRSANVIEANINMSSASRTL